MFISGSNAIANEFTYIDQLNVFPVPDGDTGTNMKLTTSGALPAIVDTNSVELVAKQFSRGVLMNARGNSGVIFSQVVRGFAMAWAGIKQLSTPKEVLAGYEQAVAASYKAVMAPVEGTMLTVIRMAAETLKEKFASLKTAESAFALGALAAKEALDKTPQMLKQLADAGVVDSGGYGLHRFLEGMHLALVGKPVAATDTPTAQTGSVPTISGNVEETGYGYCSEFIIKIPDKDLDSFGEKEFDQTIARYGSSTVTVRDEDIVKIHTHTMTPGKLMTAIQKYGEFQKIKIDNMSLQAEQHVIFTKAMGKEQKHKDKKVRKEAKRKAAPSQLKESGAAILVTVPTKEIGEKMLRDFGITAYIDESVHGNPSTGDFLKTISAHDYRRVIIITDNGNIVMAAEAAAKEAKSLDRHVKVVGGKTIIQAMAAALVYNPQISHLRNIIAMRRALHTVETALVSTSVKDIRYGRLYVKKDDYIGIHGKSVRAASNNIVQVLKKMTDYILERSTEARTIQIVTGKEHKPNDLNALVKHIHSKYKVKVETIEGNQEVYPYILGA